MNSLLERSIAYIPQLCPAPPLQKPNPKSAQILLDSSTGKPSPPPDRLGFLKKFIGSSSSHTQKSSSQKNNNSGFSSSYSPTCGGGGDEGGGAGGAPLHQHDGGDSSSSVSSALAARSEDESTEVRSFWVLNVGPSFDGAQWRRFSDDSEEEFHGRPCLLPCEVQAEIMWELVSKKKIGASELEWVKEEVEGWYRAQGFSAAKVAGFSGLSKGLLCCRISEGIITDIRVCFRDQNGADATGFTSQDVVSRHLSMALVEGMIYNKDSLKKAKRKLEQLQLFDKVKAQLTINHFGGVSIEFILHEKPQDACNFESGLSFLSNPDSGRPIPSSVRPAATLSVEHKNISGMNRTLQGYIHCNDLLRPQDDSRFKLEYIHPYVDGVDDPRDRTIRVSCYNSRKLTAVLAPPYERQVPAMWVDRAGLKTSITESFSEESNHSYGFVLEEIATRDGLGSIGDARIEHVPFFQGKITRDNTIHLNGFRVGAVDTFQVDQGVGFSNKSLMFNKHQLSSTRFIPVRFKSEDSSFSLVIVRGRYGGIVGDSPSYQEFPIRSSSSSAESGSCTSFVELMSEVRVPVWNDYAFGFVDVFSELDGVLYHGQSLRSLARNAGKGVLLGLGLKTGEFRTEFVFDCGSNSGSFNVQFGDRI